MDDRSPQHEAVDVLQELGLKEYEAKTFVALSRFDTATAKDVSEVSEVPRTRVYDAIRVLEAKGLVEVQHSNPQQFRGVSVERAIGTLEREYEQRLEDLGDALRRLEPADDDPGSDVAHEVWAITGREAVASRTRELIRSADEEVVLVVGDPSIFDDALEAALRAARDADCEVFVGADSEALSERVDAALPGVRSYVSELDWLEHSALPGDDTDIGRLLMVDRSAILVSSFVADADGDRTHEQAVLGEGFDNGLVAVVRRIVATGLPIGDLPGGEE